MDGLETSDLEGAKRAALRRFTSICEELVGRITFMTKELEEKLIITDRRLTGLDAAQARLNKRNRMYIKLIVVALAISSANLALLILEAMRIT